MASNRSWELEMTDSMNVYLRGWYQRKGIAFIGGGTESGTQIRR